jgi:hypothetical protein
MNKDTRKDKKKSNLKTEKKTRRRTTKVFRKEDTIPVMAYFFPDEIEALEEYQYFNRIKSRNDVIRHLVAKSGVFKKLDEKRLKNGLPK